ncbi:MAG: extracellular solute-binding protein [Erysipelotrichia bacterium]|nr:extracellular solute-binding protein [Erysipelotrichia bacterium]
MKKWRIWLIVSFFVVYAMAIATCYIKYSKQNITLTIGLFAGSNWDVPNGNSYQIYEDTIARFEKENPNIKVKFVSGVVKEEYSNWLAKEVVKGDAPDVFVTLADDFTTFAKAGLLTNLNSFIEKDVNFQLSKYYTSSLSAGKYKDELYALPFESVPTLMFVNKTLLEKEGIPLPSNEWTWDDFYNICKQVSKDVDGDGKLDQFGVYGYDWKSAVFANGTTLFNEDGTQNKLNDARVNEAVEFTKKLTALNQNSMVKSQDFDEGRVAFCPMEFSQYRAYMPYPWKIKKYSNFEWECISLPAGPNGDNVSEINTLSFAINAKSRNKNEAWAFFKMLTYDETTQKNIFTYSQGVSTLKKVNASEEVIQMMLEDTPGDSQFEMRLLSDVMESGVVQKRFEKYDDAISMMNNEIYRIINEVEGDISTEMNTLYHKINVYLKE